MQQQEQCNWCWAAVAASLSSAMPPPQGMQVPMSQCQVASGVLGSNCCDDGHVLNGCPDSPCNQPALIQSALGKIRHRGGASGGVPSQATVMGHIDVGRPIVGEIHWNDDQPQNHYVLIVDYSTNNSGVFVVKIADPADPTGTIPQCHSLDELNAGGYRQFGQWIGSYFTV
jgi:hypothetical protein